MGRKTFFDIVKEEGFDARNELEKLLTLLKETYYTNSHGYHSLISYIDKFAFRNIQIHDTFLHLEDQIAFVIRRTAKMPHLDTFLVFSEYLYELFIQVRNQVSVDRVMSRQIEMIKHNISLSLEKTNHCFANDAEGNNIIIEKDKALSMAVELVSDKPIAYQLIDYKHYSNRGNTEDKRKILTSIANYLEPQCKAHILDRHGYKKLETNLGFLYNNMNIRHDNMEGKSRQEYTASLNEKELEEWYDKTYQMSLFAIIALESQLAIDDSIEDIKKNNVWK